MLPVSEIETSKVSDNKTGVIHKVVEPKRHKAKLLVWTDLSVTTVDRLNESASPDHVKQVLADIFMLDFYKTNPKAAIIMDLFYNTLTFANREHFSSEKTSAFFSIIKSIFEVCIETPFRNEKYTSDYFRDLILCHSVNHPPSSIAIFTAGDVIKVSQYTTHTFFRHFDMYKHAFTSNVQLDLSFNYVGMPPSKSASEDDLEDIADITKQEDVINLAEQQHKKESLKWPMTSKQELKQEVTNILSMEAKQLDDMITEKIRTAADCLQARLAKLVRPPSSDHKTELITPYQNDDKIEEQEKAHNTQDLTLQEEEAI